MRARMLRWRIGLGAALLVALTSAASSQTPPPVTAPVTAPATAPVARPTTPPVLAPSPISPPVFSPPTASLPAPSLVLPDAPRIAAARSADVNDSRSDAEEIGSGSAAAHSYDPCQHTNPPSYCKVE